MIKKILAAALCVVMAFSLNVFAENAAEEVTPTESQQQMPQQGERMGRGGRMGGQMGQQPGENTPPQMPDGTQMPENAQRPENAQMPEGAQAPEKPQAGTGVASENAAPVGETPTEKDASAAADTKISAESETTNNTDNRAQGFRGGMQGGMNREDFGTMQQGAQSKTALDIVKENITPIISIILLIFAFVFVIFYKRKRY